MSHHHPHSTSHPRVASAAASARRTRGRNRARLLLARAFAITALGAVAFAGGCNILGPAIYLIEGPPRTPAAHEIADRPTVVFFDDRKNLISRFELRSIAGDQAAKTLLTAKVVTTTISSRDALNLVRKQETEKNLMPIDSIGRAVGAEQIIYVKMIVFVLSPDGVTPRPFAGCEVRLIDCVEKIKLFPIDDSEQGRYVEATLDQVDLELYRSLSGQRQIEDELARELGIAVAKLFFEHETNELGGNLR